MKEKPSIKNSSELLHFGLHWFAQHARLKAFTALLASGCAHSTLNDLELKTQELPVIFVEAEGVPLTPPPENELISELEALETKSLDIKNPSLDFGNWVVEKGRKVIKQAGIAGIAVGVETMDKGEVIITKMMQNNN